MKKENVYLYTRVSTAIQTEGYSLDAQRQKILDYAKYRGFKIVGEYTDAGFSGKNIAGRVQFQQMMEDIQIKKDDVKYVLVFKLSRFGRNAADVLSSLQLMQDYGVNLICVEDNIDSSADSGKLMISVMSAIAEIERENILVQTMAGRKQKATEGGWNGGFAPYGYSLKDGTLTVVEDEARVIRDVFDLYLASNLGGSYVARELNKRYPKKVKLVNDIDRFSISFVKRVLDNPVYCGKIAYGRRKNTKIEGKRNEYYVIVQKDESQIIVSTGKHPPIVSEEIWNAAHAKRLSMAEKKEKIDKDHQYLLSAIVRCPGCGAPMYGIPNGKKHKQDGTLYRPSYSYKCRNKMAETGHVCTNPKQYSENKLIGDVKEIIIDLVKNENFGALVKRSLGEHLDREALLNDLKKNEDEARRLERLQTQIENQLNSIDYDLPIAQSLEESHTKRLMKVLEDIAAVHSRNESIRNRLLNTEKAERAKEGIYEFLQHFGEIFDIMPQDQQKEFFRAFIKSIELYPKTGRSGQWIKSITFNFPMIYEGDKIFDEIVFDEDGFFRPYRTHVETVILMSRTEGSGL